MGAKGSCRRGTIPARTRRALKRKVATRLALLSASTLTAFLAMEWMLGAFEVSPSFPIPLRTIRPDLYQADSQVGYKLWPHLETWSRYPKDGPLILIESNADGFRNDRELDEQDGRDRFLMVGDSFVFGEGVVEHDRVTEVLEQLEPDWRVDNLGMPGWGLDLMMRAVQEYGPKADPDVVILAIYTHDFHRLIPRYAGIGVPYTKFELVNNRLQSVPYPHPSWLERFRISQILYRLYWARACELGVGWLKRDRNRFELHRALLDRFLTSASEVGATVVVTFFPARNDGCEDRIRRAFLASWSSEHNVPI